MQELLEIEKRSELESNDLGPKVDGSQLNIDKIENSDHKIFDFILDCPIGQHFWRCFNF